LRVLLSVGCLLSLASASGQTQSDSAFASPGVRYSLLEGSHFEDDCPVCARPVILQPMRGTFDLVLVHNTPPFWAYAVRNVDFTAQPGFDGEVHITGTGVYRRFEEFALIQSMALTTQVRSSSTNVVAVFKNDSA